MVRKRKPLLKFWADFGAFTAPKYHPKVSASCLNSAYLAAFASATVRAAMFTIRRTVVLAVRMCTGLAAPSSTGPMAMLPPAAVLSRF
jgi:hypothetical protein